MLGGYDRWVGVCNSGGLDEGIIIVPSKEGREAWSR